MNTKFRILLSKNIIVILLSIFVVGILVLYLSDKTDQCLSLLGNLVELLDSDMQQKCIYTGGYIVYFLIGCILSGLMAIVFIGLEIIKKTILMGIVFFICLVIVLLILIGLF